MAVKWIDFKELKNTLDFARLLEHYGVTFQTKGDQATTMCPLPTHEGETKSPSFSANLKRRIWQCFGCGAKGNILDFAILMEGKSPDDPKDVRSVALLLQERFGHGATESASSRTTRPKSSKRTKRRDDSDDSELEFPTAEPKVNSQEAGAVVVNQPLDFQLKGLEAKHPYLRERGFLPQTIERFGMGFCSRGMLKGRIAIPIHDEEDRLVGYAGRLVDDSQVSKTNPKYKFPPARERNGVVHEFHKSKLLYNANRILTPAMNLIVVEGFASVWWLYQWGFKDAVGLMGCDCSEEQAAIILDKVPPDGRVLVLPDADKAGRDCAISVFDAVGAERATRWVRLDDDRQPTDYTDEELFRLLSDV